MTRPRLGWCRGHHPDRALRRHAGGHRRQGRRRAEWYFPALALDFQAPLGFGAQSPVQRVLGLRATLGDELPGTLRMYAFAAEKNGAATLTETEQLAERSHIPASKLTLVNFDTTYAHSDPTGAYPTNAFLAHLTVFLHRIAGA